MKIIFLIILAVILDIAIIGFFAVCTDAEEIREEMEGESDGTMQ